MCAHALENTAVLCILCSTFGLTSLLLSCIFGGGGVEGENLGNLVGIVQVVSSMHTQNVGKVKNWLWDFINW